jgi:hypothetical protein
MELGINMVGSSIIGARLGHGAILTLSPNQKHCMRNGETVLAIGT